MIRRKKTIDGVLIFVVNGVYNRLGGSTLEGTPALTHRPAESRTGFMNS